MPHDDAGLTENEDRNRNDDTGDEYYGRVGPDPTALFHRSSGIFSNYAVRTADAAETLKGSSPAVEQGHKSGAFHEPEAGMSSAHEHIEHAEHAEHASQPFDKRVAVSVAIVAAVLAGISMLGHRKHNEVLQLQGDANRLTTEASIIQTKANIDHTHATDQWGFYQAKNIRQQMYAANLGLMDVAARDPAKGQAAEDLRKQMQGQVDKYKLELPVMMEEAKKLTESGEKKQQEALTRQDEAKLKLDDSHHAHHQADRLDYGHLGAELGIVLCSLALLTKKKVFWFVGLGSTVLALALVVSAFTLPHEPHAAHGESATSSH